MEGCGSTIELHPHSPEGQTLSNIVPRTLIYMRQHGLRQGQAAKWGVQDSNLRRLCHQIYSLTPLTARETPRLFWKRAAAGILVSERPAALLLKLKTNQFNVGHFSAFFGQFSTVDRRMMDISCRSVPYEHCLLTSQRRDLNPQPVDYKSTALPIELCWRRFIF